MVVGILALARKQERTLVFHGSRFFGLIIRNGSLCIKSECGLPLAGNKNVVKLGRLVLLAPWLVGYLVDYFCL